MLNKNSDSKKTFFLLIIIAIIAGLYRYIVLKNSNITLFSDDAIYASIARFWITGQFSKVFHPTWPPLFPFLSAIIYLFIKNWEISLQLVSILASVVIVIPLYFLFKTSLSKIHALLFVLVFTFFEPILGISVMPLSDMLATLFTVSGIVVSYLGIVKQKFKYLIFASFLFGLNYLTRPEGLLFLSLTFSFYFLYLIFSKSNRNLKNFLVLVVSIFIFAVTISPYIIASKLQSGSWSLSKKAAAQMKQGAAFEIRESGLTWSDEVVSVKNPNYKSEYFEGGADLIFNSGFLFVFFEERVNKWADVFLKHFPKWIITFVAIGFLSIFRKKIFWGIFYLLFILGIAIPLTIFITPFADPRYLAWSIPFLFLFFYLGLDNLFKTFSKNPEKSRYLFAVISTLIVLLFPSFILKYVLNPKKYGAFIKQQAEAVEIKIVSDWISKNSNTKDLKIMSRHEGFEFYLDAETIYIPQERTYEEVVEYGKKLGAKYLIIWQREIGLEKNLNTLVDVNLNKDKPIVYYYPMEFPKIVVYSIQ